MRDPHIEQALESLRRFPVIRRIEFRQQPSSKDDGLFIIHTPRGKFEYRIEIKHSTGGVLAELVARSSKRHPRWLLLSPYVSSSFGQRLIEAGIDYLDEAGNCHLDAGIHFSIHVEGFRSRPLLGGRTRPRTAGHQVLFVIAANPEIVARPVRDIAAAAGASKSQTAAMLDRLKDEGLVLHSARGRRVLRPDRIRDRWLAAYPELRRKWRQGRFRAATSDVDQLELSIARALDGMAWAWGGGAAAARLIPQYRGEETVVHVGRALSDFGKRIRAVPDEAGPLTVLTTPIPYAFESGTPHVAHPLLIYSELVAAGDERAETAAERVRERYLEESR